VFLHDKFSSAPLAFNTSPEEIYYPEKDELWGNMFVTWVTSYTELNADCKNILAYNVEWKSSLVE
jgi:hypothetical protein